MSRSKLLTREILESYGITNITEDGQVFKGDKPVKITVQQKQGKYKLQQPYARFTLSDKSRKVWQEKNGKRWWTYACVTFLVSRAMYAWYYGEVPAGYEVDHIDTNTLNNQLSNLRLLTKEENLTRKAVSRNQYNYWKTDAEILEERLNKKAVYDRKQHKLVKNDDIDTLLKHLWHSLNKEIREKQAERRECKVEDKAKWRELGIEIEELKLKAIETKKKLRK